LPRLPARFILICMPRTQSTQPQPSSRRDGRRLIAVGVGFIALSVILFLVIFASHGFRRSSPPAAPSASTTVAPTARGGPLQGPNETPSSAPPGWTPPQPVTVTVTAPTSSAAEPEPVPLAEPIAVMGGIAGLVGAISGLITASAGLVKVVRARGTGRGAAANPGSD
jgi:hypothetical protein